MSTPELLRQRSARRGSTLVEFCLVGVLLVVVMFASIEIDRMISIYTCLADAAKAGARYAIVHGSDRTGGGADGASGPGADPTQVVTAVKNYASVMINPANLTVSITYPDGTNATGGRVKVLVQYVYDPYTALPLGVTLSATSQGIITF